MPRTPYTPEELATYQADPCGFCIRELEHPDRDVRDSAADILRGLGRDGYPAIEALLRQVDDPDPMVAVSCMFAVAGILGAVRERGFVWAGPIAQRLVHENAEVRNYAALSLGYLGAVAFSVVAALRNCSTDPDPEVRESVALALARITQRP